MGKLEYLWLTLFFGGHYIKHEKCYICCQDLSDAEVEGRVENLNKNDSEEDVCYEDGDR